MNGERTVDRIDRKILNIVQSGFPVVERPFKALAEEVGVTEVEALERVTALRESGVIRKIGPVFDSQKLGYKSTLVAMAVPPARLEDAARVVSRYPEVTHNYGRATAGARRGAGRYNLWFTLIAPTVSRIEEILHEVRQETGVTDVLNLPAVRLFKIKVEFSFDD